MYLVWSRENVQMGVKRESGNIRVFQSQQTKEHGVWEGWKSS